LACRESTPDVAYRAGSGFGEGQVFGESSHASSVRVAADALQRLQNGSRNDEGVSGGDR
jgi:hypothetical protein